MKPSSDQDSPQYLLRISHRQAIRIHQPISVLHGRVIALLALAGSEHCREFPEHAPFVMGRIALEIEAALQRDISTHFKWLNICDNDEQTIQVQLDVIPAAASAMKNAFAGGGGGAGGLFGAGGGGGGGGGGWLLDGGAGGFGADGAALIFQIGHDNSLLDVDALVTPGTFEAALRTDAHTIKIVGVGGGGGGGSGGRLFDLAIPPGSNDPFAP